MLSDKTLTLNEILEIFEDIATNHQMIHDFGCGPSYNIGASRPLKHPYLWVEPTTSEVIKSSNGFKELTYSFDVYCMSKINKGDSNYFEILSDTNYIANTIIQLLSQHPNYVEYNLSLVDNINMQVVVEANDENSNGYLIPLTFKVPIKYTYCNSPIDSLPVPPLVPRYVYVYDNGNEIRLVAGETYSCTILPCDDSVITDGDGVTYSVPAGGTFSCLNASPVDIQDGDGMQYQVNPGGQFICLDASPVQILDGNGDLYNIFPGGSFTCLDASPVAVIDTDGITYSVNPGGTFSCTIPPSSSTATFQFDSGNQYNAFHRLGFVGSLTAVTTSNVSGYQYWVNGVTQSSLPATISQNDRFYISVTASSTASNAYVQFTVSGIMNPYTFSSLNYFYPRTTIFTEEVIQLPYDYYETDNAFYSDDPSVGWYGNYIASNPLVDNFEVIIPPNTPLQVSNYSVFGLNDQTVSNTPAGRPNRTKYFFGLLANVWQVYEFATLKAQLSFGNAASTWFKITGTLAAGATQGTVDFYRSSDNGTTWVSLYTSLTKYDQGTKFYYDFQHVGGASTFARYMPSRLRQL